MADQTKVKLLIDKIVQNFQELKCALDENDSIAACDSPELEMVGDFDTLKKIFESDKWPEAVNKNLICDPSLEIEKSERGRGIIELMVEENLKGLKFLDFGCGEGHSAFYASTKDAKISVGYDLKEKNWQHFATQENLLFTTDLEKVKSSDKFDVILCFDVLDHIEVNSPIEILKMLKSLLQPGGRVYLRLHPFTSRHATHLYHQKNKAYTHLVFTQEEVDKLTNNNKNHVETNIGIKYPLATYKSWADESGLNVVNSREIKDKVEDFFKVPMIADRIIKNTGMKVFPEFQMSLSFIDMILENPA